MPVGQHRRNCASTCERRRHGGDQDYNYCQAALMKDNSSSRNRKNTQPGERGVNEAESEGENREGEEKR